MSLQHAQNQPPESSGNGQTTLDKGRTDTLEEIIKNLLKYFEGFLCLEETRREIEQKYQIEKEHNCWPEDDIKRAWGKTQRMRKHSSRRRHWTRVILLQELNRRVNKDERKSTDLTVGVNLVQSCAELSLSDQACGQAQIMSENTEDRSTQSNDKPNMSASGKYGASEQANTPNSGAFRRNPHRATRRNQTEEVYNILIPFLKMSGEQLVATPDRDFNGPCCQLIDKYPIEENTRHPDIRIRKSYIISYNNKTKNANWVYEILNNDTLKINCKKNGSFGQNEFEGYEQGHLAAAANHRWCQEVYHDTFLMSNMTPQLKEVNNPSMLTVENFCRNIIEKDKNDKLIRNVHVYTGPLYLKIVRKKVCVLEPNEMEFVKEKEKKEEEKDEKEKKKEKEEKDEKEKKEEKEKKDEKEKKAVPTHFFKVAIVENMDGTVDTFSFVVPRIENEAEEKMCTTEPAAEKFIYEIDKIQEFSGLIFMESHNVNTMGKIKSIKWEGEDKKGMPCSVKIKVGIISPHNDG